MIYPRFAICTNKTHTHIAQYLHNRPQAQKQHSSYRGVRITHLLPRFVGLVDVLHPLVRDARDVNIRADAAPHPHAPVFRLALRSFCGRRRRCRGCPPFFSGLPLLFLLYGGITSNACSAISFLRGYLVPTKKLPNSGGSAKHRKKNEPLKKKALF